ncbi:MAG: hypothetical protein M1837_005756 [Sclerophora amabilis]|nr:MAG: hypothetical protein M1837_005756 [Sclerophora amabilis]
MSPITRGKRDELLALFRAVEANSDGQYVAVERLLAAGRILAKDLPSALTPDLNSAAGVSTCVWAVLVLVKAAESAIPWGGDYSQEEGLMEMAIAIFRAVDFPADVPLPFVIE